MEVPPYAGDPSIQPQRRSFQLDDLVPEIKAAGVHCTVAIEAADGLAENEALLAHARSNDWIAGVVGWVPLAHPSDAERALDPRASGFSCSISVRRRKACPPAGRRGAHRREPNTNQVRARYGGISRTSIHRKQKTQGFPMHASRFDRSRRYWRFSDLEAWEARMIRRRRGGRPSRQNTRRVNE